MALGITRDQMANGWLLIAFECKLCYSISMIKSVPPMGDWGLTDDFT